MLQVFLFSSKKRKIAISDDLRTEYYVGQPYIGENAFKQFKDTLRITQGKNYITGANRASFNLQLKLTDLRNKKRKLTRQLRVKNKYPIEKSTNSFFVDLPDYSNKFLFEFSKNHLNRVTITKKRALVFHIDIKDPEGTITVI